MAILYSAAYDQFLRIHLYEDSKSYDWIRYSLELGAIEMGRRKVLDCLCDNELFFDAEIEPEIPSLINEVFAILDNRIAKLVFMPRDERDFSLCIRKLAGTFFSARIVSDCFDNKNGQLIEYSLVLDSESLKNFITQLSEEYFALRNFEHPFK